jgi:oligopeptide transport system permease protein
MIHYIFKRILGSIPVLWLLITLTFFLIRLAPGGPFDSDKNISEEILQNILAKYHMDAPLWRQYLDYMLMILQGDFGPSFRYANRTVNEIFAETFPVSAILGLGGLSFALVIGVGSGLLAACRPHTLWDYIPMLFALIGVSLPSFVVGPILILVFCLYFRWFNVSGWDEWRDMVLPSITLGTMYAAYFARLARGGMIEILQQDFIRTARAKGLREGTIIFKHALYGGLLPCVSFLGPALASILTGSLVVETVFNIPGMGRFFVQSALNRDYTLVMGCVLSMGALIIFANLLVDISYAFLDPRIRYHE